MFHPGTLQGTAQDQSWQAIDNAEVVRRLSLTALSWGSVIAVDVLMLMIRALPVLAHALPMLTIVYEFDAIPFGNKPFAIGHKTNTFYS